MREMVILNAHRLEGYISLFCGNRDTFDYINQNCESEYFILSTPNKIFHLLISDKEYEKFLDKVCPDNGLFDACKLRYYGSNLVI